MDPLLAIDGTRGGGQILRTALSLSVCTGRGFVIDDIRAARSRPGLLRQHLTAVQAAAAICAAEVRGAELGATRLSFVPGPLRGGAHSFSVGSAGSTSLVLQTVLPPLLTASEPSSLRITGGTHNPLAPPYPFLEQAFCPRLAQMGVQLAPKLERAGFHPAGGGSLTLQLRPTSRLVPLSLLARGALRSLRAEVQLANLPHGIAIRQLAVAKEALGLDDADLAIRTQAAEGPGVVLLLMADFEHASELVTGFGMPRMRAERVAEQACSEMRRFLQAEVPVGEQLADQLLIPMALAGSGSFRTLALSDHARSNIEVVERFLPVRFDVQQEGEDRVLVRVGPRDAARA
jgi:RNA 3'-terminal phosphate cyclase (ATP)